jgi:hypothetical protein
MGVYIVLGIYKYIPDLLLSFRAQLRRTVGRGTLQLLQLQLPYDQYHGWWVNASLVPFSANNSFYSDGAKFDYHGLNLSEWQKQSGLDKGSAVLPTPTVKEMMQFGREVLEME